MKKQQLTEVNREKFFAGCQFKAGNEIGRFMKLPAPVTSNLPAGYVYNLICLLNKHNKPFIKIASLTDHSFSFLHSYFGQVNLVTVFFSELIFIVDEEPLPEPGETDENFTIDNQI